MTIDILFNILDVVESAAVITMAVEFKCIKL